jgi:hypothetical protein
LYVQCHSGKLFSNYFSHFGTEPKGSNAWMLTMIFPCTKSPRFVRYPLPPSGFGNLCETSCLPVRFHDDAGRACSAAMSDKLFQPPDGYQRVASLPADDRGYFSQSQALARLAMYSDGHPKPSTFTPRHRIASIASIRLWALNVIT